MPTVSNTNNLVEWFACVGLNIPSISHDTNSHDDSIDRTKVHTQSTFDFNISEESFSRDDDFHSFHSADSDESSQDNSITISHTSLQIHTRSIQELDQEFTSSALFFTPFPSPNSILAKYYHPILDLSYDPVILDKHYYSTRSLDKQLPPYMELFCFPQGIKLVPVITTAYSYEISELSSHPSIFKAVPSPTLHSFAITDDQGKRTYAVVLTIYQQLTYQEQEYVENMCKEWRSINMTLDDIEFCNVLSKKILEQYTEKQKLEQIISLERERIQTPLRSINDDGNLNLDRLFNDDAGKLDELQEQLSQAEDMAGLYIDMLQGRCNPGTFLDKHISEKRITLFKPISWVLGSYYPFISFLKDWLHSAYHEQYRSTLENTDSNQILCIELSKELLSQLEQLAIPSSGLFTVRVPIPKLSKYSPDGNHILYYSRPDISSFPMIQGPDYSALLNRLDIEQLVSIFEWIIAENRLVFISNDRNVLFTAAETLTRYMLYPFTWPHIYVPLLPRNLLSYLEAPVPYIIGCMSTFPALWNILSTLDRILIVFLDEHTIYHQDLGLVDQKATALKEPDTVSKNPSSIKTCQDYIQYVKSRVNHGTSSSPIKIKSKKSDRSKSIQSSIPLLPPRQRRKLIYRLKKHVTSRECLSMSSIFGCNSSDPLQCSSPVLNETIARIQYINSNNDKPLSIPILHNSTFSMHQPITIINKPAESACNICVDDSSSDGHRSGWSIGRLLNPKRGEYELLDHSSSEYELHSRSKSMNDGCGIVGTGSEILINEQGNTRDKSTFMSSSLHYWDNRRNITAPLYPFRIDSSSVDAISSSSSSIDGSQEHSISYNIESSLGHCFVEMNECFVCDQCIYCPANLSIENKELSRCKKCNISVHRCCLNRVFRPCNDFKFINDNTIQIYFTKIFVNMFQSYRKYIGEPISEESWKQRPEIFQKKAFLDHIPKECRQWMEQFLESQIFTQFLADHFIDASSYDLNQITNAIHLVHFDELIQEKIQRSKWQAFKSKLKLKKPDIQYNENIDQMCSLDFPLSIFAKGEAIRVDISVIGRMWIQYPLKIKIPICDMDILMHYKLVHAWNDYLEHRPRIVTRIDQDNDSKERRQRPQESYWIKQALEQKGTQNTDGISDVVKRVEELFFKIFHLLKNHFWVIVLDGNVDDSNDIKLEEFQKQLDQLSFIGHGQHQSRTILFYISGLIRELSRVVQCYISKSQMK